MPYAEHIDEAKGQRARCAIVTLSDTRTEATDKSGRRIRELLTEAEHSVVAYAILPDDPARLEPELSRLLGRDDVDVILTNGGTGISKRDQTIGVVEKIIEQPLPGFG